MHGGFGHFGPLPASHLSSRSACCRAMSPTAPLRDWTYWQICNESYVTWWELYIYFQVILLLSKYPHRIASETSDIGQFSDSVPKIGLSSTNTLVNCNDIMAFRMNNVSKKSNIVALLICIAQWYYCMILYHSNLSQV